MINTTISIYERERVMEQFKLYPNGPIRLYVPASGSWYETFFNKEQYMKRMEAWDNYPFAIPSWYELRGKVSWDNYWMNDGTIGGQSTHDGTIGGQSTNGGSV